MTMLTSQFDVCSVDNPMAMAALAQTLAVDSPPGLDANGTPQAGTIPAGMVVQMNTAGKAVPASTIDISAADKALVFVVIDGNVDFDGCFVEVLTVLHGGFTMWTDQFVAGAFVPGKPVTFGATTPGMVELMTVRATQQLLGFVGPAGLDTSTTPNRLQVIVPQGAGL